MAEHDIWNEIVVDRSERTSPYRQIAHSLRHKIATNQIPSSTVLPSVRRLADRIGVTPATVARAYKLLQDDGLVESQAGVGTVVSDTQKLLYASTRHSPEELDEAIDTALWPLLQAGHALPEIREAVDRRLRATVRTQHAVVVSDTPPPLEKYIDIMRGELGPLGVQVHGVLLRQGVPSAETCETLRRATRVLTSLGLLRRVQDLVTQCQASPPISVIFTELNLRTIERISALPSDARTLLVAEDRYRNSILGILRQHMPQDHVTALRDLDPASLKAALNECDVVVYSLSQRDLVRSTVGPHHQTILMDYQVRQDAMMKLRQSFLAEHAPAAPFP